MAAAGLELVIREEPRVLRMEADQGLLVAALVRLIDNVIRHASQARTITLTSEAIDDSRMQFRIRDDGVGMAPDRVAAALRRFRRRPCRWRGCGKGSASGCDHHGNRAPAQGASGYGLGAGKGTEVVITLPLKP